MIPAPIAILLATVALCIAIRTAPAQPVNLTIPACKMPQYDPYQPRRVAL